MEKTPFWAKTWFIILATLIAPPIGIVLMWLTKKSWKTLIKIILSIVLGFWALLWGLVLIGMTVEPTDTPEDITSITEVVAEDTTTATQIQTETTEFIATTTSVVTTNHTTTEKETTTAKPTTTEKETTTAKPTTTEIETTTAKPTTTKKETTTTKPTTTKKVTTTVKPTTTKVSEPAEKSSTNYVLNTNTMKFHYPSCSSVGQIKPENKEYFNGNREDIINQGFSPCGRCHP